MDQASKGFKRLHSSSQHSPNSPKQDPKRRSNHGDNKVLDTSRHLRYDQTPNVSDKSENPKRRMNPIDKFSMSTQSENTCMNHKPVVLCTGSSCQTPAENSHPNTLMRSPSNIGNSTRPLSVLDQNILHDRLNIRRSSDKHGFSSSISEKVTTNSPNINSAASSKVTHSSIHDSTPFKPQFASPSSVRNKRSATGQQFTKSGLTGVGNTILNTHKSHNIQSGKMSNLRFQLPASTISRSTLPFASDLSPYPENSASTENEKMSKPSFQLPSSTISRSNVPCVSDLTSYPHKSASKEMEKMYKPSFQLPASTISRSNVSCSSTPTSVYRTSKLIQESQGSKQLFQMPASTILRSEKQCKFFLNDSKFEATFTGVDE